MAHRQLRPVLGLRLTSDDEERLCEAGIQRVVGSQRRRVHAGQAAHTLQQRLDEAVVGDVVRARVGRNRIPHRRCLELHLQHSGDVESRVGAIEVPETANQQAGPGEQDDGKRHLDDDQR